VLSVVIMTHPARADRSLLIARKYPKWDLSVVTDPDPDGRRGALRTARVAWRTITPGATHHLVIQDDVDFQPNFFEQVSVAAARHPDKALAFFAEWGCQTASVVRIAALRGASWAEVIDSYIPTQALLLPAEAAREAAEYLATVRDDTSDDGTMHEYLLKAGLPQLVSVPNLVQHLDLPSVSGNARMGPRRATCYSPALAAGGLRGDTAVTGLTRVPYYSWWAGRGETCIRADARSILWRIVPTAAMLADDLRVTSSSLQSACTAGLAEISPGFREAGLVDEATIRHLWFAAFGLGVAAAGERRSATGDARTAELSLRSFVPGALRNVMSPANLALAARALTPAMVAAVHAGYATLT
jgi:hypothetical protein